MTDAEIIVAFAKKLNGLGIKAEIMKVEHGPVIDGFYFRLNDSTPIAKILKADEDFALAAHVESVTIVRDKGSVIIFVPKKERTLVDFKECLHWVCTDPATSKMVLPLILGVDHLGNKAALDLTEQPHVLIAGQTGSGKSVLQSAIISALAVFKDETELQIILVDTKGLDLPLFSGLPHVKEVVTELNQFHRMMQFTLKDIRNRMEKLKSCKVRNIGEYNGLLGKGTMKYKLIVIDELADLIDQDRFKRKGDKDYADTNPTISSYLKSTLQIARAAGVHIIAGTQRSSVTIVNGDIKANLPCRIALRLPSRDDSKTILGTNGAEALLGKGDMLIQRSGSDSFERYHGPFVKLEDIAYVISAASDLRNMFNSQRQMIEYVRSS